MLSFFIEELAKGVAINPQQKKKKKCTVSKNVAVSSLFYLKFMCCELGMFHIVNGKNQEQEFGDGVKIAWLITKKIVQVTINFEDFFFFFSEPQGSLYKLSLNVNLEAFISYSKELIYSCHRKNMLITSKYQKGLSEK